LGVAENEFLNPYIGDMGTNKSKEEIATPIRMESSTLLKIAAKGSGEDEYSVKESKRGPPSPGTSSRLRLA
jgi:hypothetical protein